MTRPKGTPTKNAITMLTITRYKLKPIWMRSSVFNSKQKVFKAFMGEGIIGDATAANIYHMKKISNNEDKYLLIFIIIKTPVFIYIFLSIFV